MRDVQIRFVSFSQFVIFFFNCKKVFLCKSLWFP